MSTAINGVNPDAPPHEREEEAPIEVGPWKKYFWYENKEEEDEDGNV